MGQAADVSGLAALERMVRAATVALEVETADGRGTTLGTGFFVAPGIVATCAHVLADSREQPPVVVRAVGRELDLSCRPEWYLRDGPHGVDLAFLETGADSRADSGTAHVLLSDSVAVGDVLWTYGHPAGRFRAGQSALFTAQGRSRVSAVTEDADAADALGSAWEPERVAGTPVGGGYSGSAVLNRRTGAVAGMLCYSDGAGSAHLVSAAEIDTALRTLFAQDALLPEEQEGPPTTAANAAWLSALSDAQILAGGWRFPGPQLRRYLDAAVRAAEEHPYPGVVPATVPPPLTTVYLRQQARKRAQDGSDNPLSSGPLGMQDDAVPAGEIFAFDQDCVVSAGPGAGKSSLLRTGLVAAARRWRAGDGGTFVPVRVLAADLVPAQPLPELIAAGVEADLSTVGLIESWPPAFFRTGPLRGVRWLVLVDGLDEVTEQHARVSVLTKLAGMAQGGSLAAEGDGADGDGDEGGDGQSLPYRFVVATRPLPEDEFAAARARHWSPRRYELLPFDFDQLGGFAANWFAALELPEPDRAASAFLTEVDRAHVADLARIPLLATMLCQLYAANPDRRLPTGRAGVYRRFVELLQDRQRSADLRSRTSSALARFGPNALQSAERILDESLDLISRLAAAQLAEQPETAVGLLAVWTADERPRHVTPDAWATFLGEVLRRSGLMIERGDTFVFLHQTLLEFLAARHIVNDEDGRATALSALFSWKQVGSGRQARWEWEGRAESFVTFLVEAMPNDPSVVRELKRVAEEGGHKGCEFIADCLDQGVELNRTVVAAARSALAELAMRRADSGHLRIGAARTLARLGDPRAAKLLAAMAKDPKLRQPKRSRSGVHRSAVRTLAGLGDPQSADLLAMVAATAEDYVRDLAADALAELGDARAAELYAKLAADRGVDGFYRLGAAKSLAGLGDPRAADLIAALATLSAARARSKTGEDIRSKAALTLRELGDARAPDLLARLAADHTVADRVSCAAELTRLGDARAGDLLAGMAADHTDTGSMSYAAAAILAEIGDARAADLLAAIAADRALDGYYRLNAARALAGLDDTRAADLLAAIADDSAVRDSWRGQAGSRLAELGDERAVDLLYQTAANPTADGQSRYEATHSLAELGDARAADLYQAIAVDPDVYTSFRLQAAKRSAELDPSRGADLLAFVASAPAVFDSDRLQAAQVLAALGDARAADLLTAIADDPATTYFTKDGAESALAALRADSATDNS